MLSQQQNTNSHVLNGRCFSRQTCALVWVYPEGSHVADAFAVVTAYSPFYITDSLYRGLLYRGSTI